MYHENKRTKELGSATKWQYLAGFGAGVHYPWYGSGSNIIWRNKYRISTGSAPVGSGLAWSLYKCSALRSTVYGASATERPLEENLITAWPKLHGESNIKVPFFCSFNTSFLDKMLSELLNILTITLEFRNIFKNIWTLVVSTLVYVSPSNIFTICLRLLSFYQYFWDAFGLCKQ